jgi:hypothetical protein
MTPEQFCYWLQGFAELSGDNPPTPEQWKSIREHIATVFKKVTPPVDSNKTVPLDLAGLQRAFDEKKKCGLWPNRPSDQPYTLNKLTGAIC